MTPEERYEELLDEGGRTAIDAEIRAAVIERGISYGGRSACSVMRPLFVPAARNDDLASCAHHVIGALHVAARAARNDPALWDLLRLTRTEERLLAVDAGFTPQDLVGRLDGLFDPEGTPRFLEYNGESPGGIAFGDALAEVFADLEPMRRMAREFDLVRRPVMPDVVDAYLGGYREWASRQGRQPAAVPLVAIVDVAGIPTISEFHMFRAVFEARGARCRVATCDEIAIRRDHLVVDDEPVDIVYRRLLTPDLIERYEGEHPLVDAMARGMCFVANGFDGALLSHKSLFAILSDPELRPAGLGVEQRRAVERSIPWTRIARDVTTTDAMGRVARLKEIVRRDRARLVLKPAAGYGGRGVYLGWETTDAEWIEAWEAAKESGRWIVQARESLPRGHWPVVEDGEPAERPLRYDVCPYVLEGGRITGIGVRLSPTDLLNVAAGAGSTVPAFVFSSNS